MSTKEQRDEWQRLSEDATGVGFGKANAAFYMVAREAVPTLLQDVERLTNALEDARSGICTIYHLIDSDREIKAMKHCKNVTDPIDAVLAAVRK